MLDPLNKDKYLQTEQTTTSLFWMKLAMYFVQLLFVLFVSLSNIKNELVNEPYCEKTCFCHMQTNAQISLPTWAVCVAPFLFARLCAVSSHAVQIFSLP